MSDSVVRLSDYARLVRTNRNFRLMWVAQIVSEMGDWFYSVAIFAFLLQTKGTAQSVAFAFVLQVLPQCFAAPMAGVINDRLSRKKVMIFADWMRAGIVLSMLLVRSQDMVWLLYVLLFLETVMWALFEPARSAVVPNITSKEELLSANALTAATWSFNFAVGSALGGFVAALASRNTVFVLNSLSFVLSAILITRMRFHEPHIGNQAPLRLSDLADFTPIVEGMKYVLRDVRLAVTMLVKAGLSVMGTNWVIIPILGERTFPVSVAGFNAEQASTLGMSILMAARGAGAVFGALGSSSVAGSSQPRLRRSIFAGFLLSAAGYLALAGAPNIWLACLTLIVAHAGGSIIWTASATLMMEQTEDRFRGRVFSAEFALSMGTLAAVSYAGAYLLDHHMTVRMLCLWTGVGLLVPAFVWAQLQYLWKRPTS